MINSELWNKIEAFDFDYPLSGYGFSTRLAKENFWTREFTRKAIIEYKKFMFLAGTSEYMVSPSEVVDTIWHQHLVFTQSYSDFCNIIGKTIQHIPSTHNRSDFEKFKQAKERTTALYSANFGAQPTEIWERSGMFEALELEKSKLKIRTFILLGGITFLILIIPFYYLLRPLYIHVPNPHFLTAYFFFSIVFFTIIESYNTAYLKKAVMNFNKCTFIWDLQPLELIYLRSQKIASVIHPVVSRLYEAGKIKMNKDNTLEWNLNSKAVDNEEVTIMDMLQEWKLNYPYLLKRLSLKPVFMNIQMSMDAFKKYFIKSKVFGKLFYLNFGAISIMMMFGLVRFFTGLLRDKPVTYIFFFLIIFTVASAYHLWRLTNLVNIKIIPEIYKTKGIVNTKFSESSDWDYFLNGNGVLAAAILPLVITHEKENTFFDNSSGTGSSSSCGSSCSSCGGGCGGCGGS